MKIILPSGSIGIKGRPPSPWLCCVAGRSLWSAPGVSLVPCCRVVDSSVIFDTLYHLCGLGAATSYQAGNIRTAHRVLAEQARLHGLHLPPCPPAQQSFSKANVNSSESLQGKSSPVGHSGPPEQGYNGSPPAASAGSSSSSSSESKEGGVFLHAVPEGGGELSGAASATAHTQPPRGEQEDGGEGETGKEGRGEGPAEFLFFGGLYDQEILPLVHPSAPIDWPHSCFRIKLVCTLLQTCGHYFCRGSLKCKLDRFLLFFQRFIRAKVCL